VFVLFGHISPDEIEAAYPKILFTCKTLPGDTKEREKARNDSECLYPESSKQGFGGGAHTAADGSLKTGLRLGSAGAMP